MEGRTDGRKDGRTDGSVTISLRNFVGKGIIKQIELFYINSRENRRDNQEWTIQRYMQNLCKVEFRKRKTNSLQI